MTQYSRTLLRWYERNRRDLPWVGNKDPYQVWLSEIIMQQTRVEHGTKYYLQFIRKFPSVKDLALASQDTVMKQWEGLGYYSRARNLHQTAKTISEKYGGIFPDDFQELKKLKGIGDYTAAAIASYAFNQPYAVTDANVFRILARIFGIHEPIYSNKGKKIFAEKAQEILDVKQPARHNQAMMDFGALVCKPIPVCGECPFRKICYAYQHDEISILPVKAKKTDRRKRRFHYFVITDGKKYIIEKREHGDIWTHLYQFPLLESGKLLSQGELLQWAKKNFLNGESPLSSVLSKPFRQVLTHQEITARFLTLIVRDAGKYRNNGSVAVKKPDIKKIVFPGIIRTFLKEFSKFKD